MTLDRIITLIIDVGVPMLVTGMVLYFGFRWVQHKLNQEISGKSLHTDFPFEYDIQRHSVLSTLEIFYSTTVHTICFSNPFKQMLWIDFLTAYYKAMHEYIEQGLENNYHQLPHAKFKEAVTSWILQLVPYCEERVATEVGQYFEQPEVLSMIIQKFRILFRQNHTQFFTGLSELFETSMLVNNKQRLATILYAWKTYNMLAMTMFEKVLNDLNGDLNNMTYKGVKNSMSFKEERIKTDRFRLYQEGNKKT